MMKKIAFMMLIAASQIVFALPQTQLTAGGIALITLPEYAPNNVQVFFNNTQVPIITQQNERIAIVGIPLSINEGNNSVILQAPDFMDTLSFNVEAKDYPEQRISLKQTQSNKVTPNEEELARYSREAAEQKAVYQSFSTATLSWPSFKMPIQGKISSPFGLKRFFNDQARDPHSGLDIVAAEGKAVAAPADGVVAQTGDYFFNGQTVMLDHGQGIISMMCHLSKIDVVKGQTIKQGEIIGKVGHTGRATGPHLHWGVSINNARVNPLLVLDK
jgi:murein DD-endopeptidase MepM/ murein hydrolase activator NlpD